MRANRGVRDECAVLDLDDAERFLTELDAERQPLPQLRSRAERKGGFGSPRLGSCVSRQGLPAHHHRLVLVPQALAAAPAPFADGFQPFLRLLRQIIPHLNSCPARPEGLHKCPNLGAGPVSCEGPNTVAGPRAVDSQLKKNAPIGRARLFCELEPPTPAADLQQLDMIEVIAVQYREMLPVEDVFPDALDPGSNLPLAGRRKLQGGGDLQAVPIDVQRGLLGAERFTDAIIRLRRAC